MKPLLDSQVSLNCRYLKYFQEPIVNVTGLCLFAVAGKSKPFDSSTKRGSVDLSVLFLCIF